MVRFCLGSYKKDKDLFALIELCDVLIDGKFQIENKDLTLKWRGSRNQRVVDVKKYKNRSIN